MIGQLDKLVNHFQKWLGSAVTELEVGATLVFLFASVAVPDDKFLFVLAAVYVIGLRLLSGSLTRAIIVAFVPLSIFNVGQVRTFQVVPAEAVVSPLYPNGRLLPFTLSPLSILQLTILFWLPFRFLFRISHLSLPTVLIILAGFFSTLSATTSSFLPHVSLLLLLPVIGVLGWLMLLNDYVENSNKAEVWNLFKVLTTVLGLVVVFNTLVAGLQFITRSTLGLTIEQTQFTPLFGGAADENNVQFRPIGLTGHANALSYLLITQLSAFFMLVSYCLSLHKRSLTKLSVLIVSVAALLTVVLTQSRAVWLGLLLAGFLYYIFHKTQALTALSTMASVVRKLRIFGLGLVVVISIIVTDRVLHSFASLSRSGGLTLRAQLLQEAVELFQLHPIIGVGYNMYIPANFFYHPTGSVTFFPEPVHHGLVLQLVEGGLVTTAAWLAAIFFLTRAMIRSALPTQVKWSFFLGLIVQLTVMQFQPTSAILPLYIVIALILLKFTHRLRVKENAHN